jgi:hypothetical protein
VDRPDPCHRGAAFVISALAGGVLAQYTSTRLTYLVTVPLVGLAIIGFLRFDEPRLHQAEEGLTLRGHIALTFRTMITQEPCCGYCYSLPPLGCCRRPSLSLGHSG